MSDTFVDQRLNPTGLLAWTLLTATLSKDQDLTTVELVLDLSCLCQTLQVLSRRFHNAYVFNDAQLQTLQGSLQSVRNVLLGHTNAHSEHVLDAVARACTTVNRVMAETSYIMALPSGLIIYPSDLVVQRDSSPDRYDMQKDCVLESSVQLSERVRKEASLWNSLERSRKAVYEHVGRLDGGEDMYDPPFLSRCPSAAAEYFTPGRVFVMLWDTQKNFQIDGTVAHYDWRIGPERRFLTAFEGFYTGPYRGPVTARWFIVIHGSDASCFCLSIVNLPAHLRQIDHQRYISIACTGSNDPQSALQIQSLPLRAIKVHEKTQQRDIPPPSSFPTGDLPLACSDQVAATILAEEHGQVSPSSKTLPPEERQRIRQLMDRKYYVDAKRLVEVESSVKVRNVGVVQGSDAFDYLISIAGSI